MTYGPWPCVTGVAVIIAMNSAVAERMISEWRGAGLGVSTEGPSATAISCHTPAIATAIPPSYGCAGSTPLARSTCWNSSCSC